MPLTRTILAAASALLLLGGCSSTSKVERIPPDVDVNRVPHQTVTMTAEHFHFTPDVLHIPVGTLVELQVKSLDGTHGFTLDHYGIDETIEEGQTKTVTFFAGDKGEFGFHCSHFCGIGHFWMNGKIIVEAH